MERDKRLITDYLAGTTIKQLTHKYGLKSAQISALLRYNNIHIKGGGRSKSLVNKSELLKITPQILKLYSAGESFTSLAIRFNLEINQVLQVINSSNPH